MNDKNTEQKKTRKNAAQSSSEPNCRVGILKCKQMRTKKNCWTKRMLTALCNTECLIELSICSMEFNGYSDLFLVSFAQNWSLSPNYNSLQRWKSICQKCAYASAHLSNRLFRQIAGIISLFFFKRSIEFHTNGIKLSHKGLFSGQLLLKSILWT